MEEDSYIRVRGGENATLEELNTLQDEIAQLVGGNIYKKAKTVFRNMKQITK